MTTGTLRRHAVYPSFTETLPFAKSCARVARLLRDNETER